MCQKVEKAVSQEASKDNIPVTKYKSDNLAVKIKKKKKGRSWGHDRRQDYKM